MADRIEELALQEVELTTGDQEYSDEQLGAIVREIITDSDKKSKESSVFVGKHLDNDWDADLYISDLYEMYLQTVQQDQPLKHRNGARLDPKTCTFEQYLELCLETLTIRREELKEEHARGYIDLRVYNNGKMLADMAEDAIKSYMSKTETAKLIGV